MSASLEDQEIVTAPPAERPRPETATTPGGRGHGRLRRVWDEAAAPGAVVLLVLVVWEVAARAGLVQDFVLPPPTSIARAFIDYADPLLQNTWVTLVEAILGFLLGNVAGVVLAAAFVHSRVLERSVYPLVFASKSIPFVALTPILVLQFGSGIFSKVMIAAFMVFFPTLINMISGLRSVSPDVLELFDSMSASKWRIFYQARFPSSLPYLFSSLRMAAGACFIGAVAAEWIGSDRGLGYLITAYNYQFQIPAMWAAVAIASAMAVAMFGLVALVERRVTPWDQHPGEISVN